MEGPWKAIEVEKGQVKRLAMKERGMLWMAWHGMEGGDENQCCLEGVGLG